MKKFVAAFGILLLGSFFVFNTVFSANTDIIINEIGAYATSTHEWIEIWNKGSEPVDLTGWKFWENNTNHGLSVSSTDAVVSVGEYAVIVQDANQFILDYPFFLGSIFDSSWTSLNESGEEIGLKDSEGNFIEQFTYISAPDYSLQRRDPFLADYTSANWAEHVSSNTVGFLNNFLNIISTTTASSTDNEDDGVGGTPTESDYSNWLNLKLNEFVSDPDLGNEWVEIFNLTTSSLDVAGGYICDSKNTTSTCKIISGIIPANGWLKIDLQTDSYLNNTGDTVILKNPDGDIIDSVVYSEDNAPTKGQSWARSVDGEGNWQITTQITPEAANVIVAPVVQSQSGSGSGGGSSFVLESPNTVSSSSKKTNSASTIKKSKEEKNIGLKWKIKYDLRLRQNEENVFDASKSIDPRGGRINYSWNFGGQIISGATIKYSFTTSGTHSVVVRATSTAGTVDEKKLTIMVYPATETSGSGIIFSELLPRASSIEDEYIQLKNISDHAVNMSNWKIVYKNDIYEIPTSTFLSANDYLTFYQTITGFTLNNSGAELLLLNQENILIDQMEYGKADENVAYIFNGEKWSWKVPTTSAKVLGIKITTTEKKTSTSGKFFTSIADARAGQKGDWARVKGVVAVLPGIFGSQYFYLTDGNSGIQIYQNKKDFPPLEVGDLVQVYGMISEASGIKRINARSKDDIDILAIGGIVTSTELNVDEIDEALAGGLVQTEGEITEIKSNFMYIDNGSDETVAYFKQGAKIDKHKFKEGENVRVVGILEQTKTGWQIWPRSQSDIESLGPSADLLAKESVNKAVGAKPKYWTATAGGAAAMILAFLARARGPMMLGGIKKIFKKDKIENQP
ncbi:MAG: Nucleic acid binding OB-fold tRNA/helicase-type [Parcubacteria group bacterium Gr01-1014_13]|nr:MAG: Nucleic acid binding OB-fold tRNA/helicase-type [Parcubacteria group bacterium Gr01-1014_13]